MSITTFDEFVKAYGLNPLLSGYDSSLTVPCSFPGCNKELSVVKNEVCFWGRPDEPKMAACEHHANVGKKAHKKTTGQSVRYQMLEELLIEAWAMTPKAKKIFGQLFGNKAKGYSLQELAALHGTNILKLEPCYGKCLERDRAQYKAAKAKEKVANKAYKACMAKAKELGFDLNKPDSWDYSQLDEEFAEFQKAAGDMFKAGGATSVNIAKVFKPYCRDFDLMTIRVYNPKTKTERFFVLNRVIGTAAMYLLLQRWKNFRRQFQCDDFDHRYWFSHQNARTRRQIDDFSYFRDFHLVPLDRAIRKAQSRLKSMAKRKDERAKKRQTERQTALKWKPFAGIKTKVKIGDEEPASTKKPKPKASASGKKSSSPKAKSSTAKKATSKAKTKAGSKKSSAKAKSSSQPNEAAAA